jgi:hypothetical protein
MKTSRSFQLGGRQSVRLHLSENCSVTVSSTSLFSEVHFVMRALAFCKQTENGDEIRQIIFEFTWYKSAADSIAYPLA